MSELPYQDTKPQGAADFYYATNATFRFLLRRIGRAGWVRYLEDLGRGYYAPVNEKWRTKGLVAVANYWRDFFAAEPGGQVEVIESEDRVDLVVQVCPLIQHLKAGGREIVPEFCQHCFYLGSTRAEAAGLSMRLCGGNGSCRHTYAKTEAGLVPQDLSEIKEARL